MNKSWLRAKSLTCSALVGCLLLLQLGQVSSQAQGVYPKDTGEMNFAVAASALITDEKMVLSGFNLLAEIMAEKWSGPYSVTVVPTVTDVLDAFQQGTANIGYIGTYDYLLHRDKGVFKPELLTVYDDTEVERFVVLSRSNHALSFNASSLQGKRLQYFVRGDDRLMKLWLDDALGASAATVIDEFAPAKKASALIHSVFFGQLDGAIVPASTFRTACDLNPQLGQKLQVLVESPPLPANLFCSCVPYTGVNIETVTDVGLKLATYPKGRQIFALTRIQGLARFHPSQLDEPIRLMTKYNLLPAPGASTP